MNRIAALVAGISLAALICVPGDAANLRFRGGTVTPDPPTTDTCPKGLAYTAFDGCLDANPNGQFRNANLISTYALDIDGDPQTIHHAPPYNVAGQDFPVGQTTTGDKDDPMDFTVAGVATFQTTTVTFTRIDNGGTPKIGMYVWDRPSNGTAWFPSQNMPKISGACTGSIPAIVCPLDRTIQARGAFNVYASIWPGCVLLIPNGGANGSSGETFNEIYCDFRNSANGMTADIENLEFGAINGHPATVLIATSHNTGTQSGTVNVNNSHLAPDANSAGHYTLSSGVSGPNVRLNLTNSECDGGNGGDPIGGPFTNPQWFGCVSWDSPGSATLGRNQVLFKNIYAHDYAGNPFSPQAGNTDTIAQNIVTNRVSLNCGDDTPPNGTSNGCHGTVFAYGTTLRGSSGSIKVRNLTAIYPYGQRNGVITAAASLQGGVSSAASLDVEFSGLAIVANTGGAAGHASIGGIARVHRVGAISNLLIRHLYANSHGTAGCFVIAGDLQANAASTGAMVANAGQRSSTITFSGIASTGQPTLPYPGTWLVPGAGSSAPEFKATMTNLGTTSRVDITSLPLPSTIAAGKQLAALQIANPTTNPTLVVSGSGSSYIVDNGSGSGEDRAEQAFTVAQILMPFGTINPVTGLPSTATGGSASANYNGTWVAGGEFTATPASPNNWSAKAPGLGNSTTVVSDSVELWMMNIAGDAGKITLDGVNLEQGNCPGTQAP